MLAAWLLVPSSCINWSFFFFLIDACLLIGYSQVNTFCFFSLLFSVTGLMPRCVDEGWWPTYALGLVQGSMAHLVKRPGFYLFLVRKSDSADRRMKQWEVTESSSFSSKETQCLNLLYSSPRKFTAKNLTNWRWAQRASRVDYESVMGTGEPGLPQLLPDFDGEAPATARLVRLPSPSPWHTALPDLPLRRRSMQPALSAGGKN